MIFPFLASLLVFVTWLSYRYHKQDKIQKNQSQTFWEREAEANNVRKQPLDQLDYITIPFESLPTDILADQNDIADCLSTLRTLSEQKIVNFTGFTNTDLKLQYGAPNITILTQYDQNYTLLARTLQKWANLLYESGETEAARQVLEFAVSTRTDVSGSYRLLKEIYTSSKETEKIAGLIETANTLQSAMKPAILRMLQE